MKRCRARRGRRTLAGLVTGILIAFVSVESPSGQECADLTGLQRSLEPGDHVRITTAAGQRLNGKLASLSDRSLRLLVGATVLEVQSDEVAQVDLRKRDALWNGLLIGAGIGAAVFYDYHQENALCQAGCQFASGAAATIATGAALGLLTDVLIVRRKTVFVRSGPEAQRLQVASPH